MKAVNWQDKFDNVFQELSWEEKTGSAFERIGYQVLLNPAPDGNCQFGAICDQLSRLDISQMSPADLRQAAVNYMIEHRISPLSDRPDFSTTFDSDRFSSFENNITTMAQDATYGDHLTLQALSELFFVPINVCSAQGKMYDRVNVPREGLTDLPIVYLGYFPEGNGEHYVSLETVVDFEVGDETVDGRICF